MRPSSATASPWSCPIGRSFGCALPFALRSGLCRRSIKALKPTDDRPGGASDCTNLRGLAAKGRCLRMRQPRPAEEVTSSPQRPRPLSKWYEKEQGRELNVVCIAAWKVRSMPEADHGSAAAKYFLTRSLVVRTRLLIPAGPDSVKARFAVNLSSRAATYQICRV